MIVMSKNVNSENVFCMSKSTESASFTLLQNPMSNVNTERAFVPFLNAKKTVSKQTKRKSVSPLRALIVKKRSPSFLVIFFTPPV